ncbi:helix-turn-helix domain-containing protein [Paenibacillus koleovorans]|uniref:helix-turn-helix domain-containing protein n=1 Tax=Paenibacillus koleovorans TaxID=121608 RepID=UPI000FD7AD62|nr:helix-turn-helix domain-containing protein [Paenibacillus koleovorans]
MFGLKKNSVISRWIRSYAIVLFIPIAIMFVTYFQTRHVIEEEINRANQSLLSQFQQDMDKQIEYAYRLSEVISINSKVRQLMQIQGAIVPEDRMAMVNALADFKVYNSSNRYSYRFYLYFHKSNFILTESSYYEPEVFYKTMQANSGLSFEEWKRFLGQMYRGQFFSMHPDHGQKAEGILFVQTLPLDDQSGHRATLVIELNNQSLLAAMQNIQSYNQGNVYILDGANQLMATSEETKPMSDMFDGMIGERGTIQRQLDGEDVIISYIQSKITTWKYVYVLPSELYSQKAEYVRNLTVLTLIISIAVGAILAILLARHNYYPLQQLVRSVAARSRLDHGVTINEYDFLEEAIENTMDINNQMNRMIEKQKTVLRFNLLVRILKGRLGQDFPVLDAMADYGMKLRSDHFAVLLFYLEDFSGIFHKDETDAEKKRELVHLILSNIVEEMVGQKYQGWMTEIDEMLACIINLEPDVSAEEAKQELTRITEEAQRFISGRFHIFFTVSVSTVRRTISELPTAYQEALDAMEYKMVFGTQTVIFYDQIQSFNRSYVYSLENEQQLINHVKAGDFEHAKRILDEVITHNLTDKGLSIDMVRCLMFDIISTMMKAAIEVNLDQTELYMDNMKAVEELMDGVTVTAMTDRMIVFLEKVCDHVHAKKRSHNFRLKENVLEFINREFRDHNLSITTISDEFDIHPSYLSRYFKEQVGESLTDYINKFRVNKAIELLKDDNILIKDICDLVGFYSISTFIRLFKKYEGVTPSVYRESRKNS